MEVMFKIKMKKHYYQGMTGLIFVIDSNDRERLPIPKYQSNVYSTAKDELHRMLQEDEAQHIPLLIYANKQDLPQSLSTEEVIESLGVYVETKMDWKKFSDECELQKYVNEQGIIRCIYDFLPGVTYDEVNPSLQRDVHVQGCCATTGEGLYEGLEWLFQAMAKKFPKK